MCVSLTKAKKSKMVNVPATNDTWQIHVFVRMTAITLR
jgi:hypothetical protein